MLRSTSRALRQPCVQRPGAGAERRQREKAARYRQVFLKMNELIGIGEIAMKEQSGEQRVDGEANRRQARQKPEQNEHSAAEFDEDDKADELRPHAEAAHIVHRAADVADLGGAFVDEDRKSTR